MKRFSPASLSAKVELFLKVGKEMIGVAQTGRDFLILDVPQAIEPATDAELIVILDGHADSRSIFIPNGTNENSCRVDFF